MNPQLLKVNSHYRITPTTEYNFEIVDTDCCSSSTQAPQKKHKGHREARDTDPFYYLEVQVLLPVPKIIFFSKYTGPSFRSSHKSEIFLMSTKICSNNKSSRSFSALIQIKKYFHSGKSPHSPRLLASSFRSFSR